MHVMGLINDSIVAQQHNHYEVQHAEKQCQKHEQRNSLPGREVNRSRLLVLTRRFVRVLLHGAATFLGPSMRVFSSPRSILAMLASQLTQLTQIDTMTSFPR